MTCKAIAKVMNGSYYDAGVVPPPSPLTSYMAAVDDQDDEDDVETKFCDLRVVAKPSKLSDEKSRWMDWRFNFENYMSCVSAKYVQEMETAAERKDPIVTIGVEAAQRRSYTLYAVLASITSGKASQIVRKLKKTRNGYEAWRLIVAEFEPKSDNRQLAMMWNLMEARGLMNATAENFESVLMTWEESVK